MASNTNNLVKSDLYKIPDKVGKLSKKEQVYYYDLYRAYIGTILDIEDLSIRNRIALEYIIAEFSYSVTLLHSIKPLLFSKGTIDVYNNGGQHGDIKNDRSSPLFRNYLDLSKRVMENLDKLYSYLPEQSSDELNQYLVSLIDKLQTMNVITDGEEVEEVIQEVTFSEDELNKQIEEVTKLKERLKDLDEEDEETIEVDLELDGDNNAVENNEGE